MNGLLVLCDATFLSIYLLTYFLPISIASFRPQVILAFSGTSNARLAMYDIKANLTRYQTSFSHPKKESWRVHDGFQMVFQGVRAPARKALRQAMEILQMETGTCNGEWDLVLTAHSLGTAISYLFLLDILHEEISPDSQVHQEYDPLPSIPPSVNITIASFGPPRVANPALVGHFIELTREFRERREREEALTEWTVIGHNDGKL
jgi:Lipase (class 3)